jgi:hypothetical protein
MTEFWVFPQPVQPLACSGSGSHAISKARNETQPEWPSSSSALLKAKTLHGLAKTPAFEEAGYSKSPSLGQLSK